MKDREVYVCGDTHGLTDFYKITKFKSQNPSVIIQLGDFGCFWDYNPNKNNICFDKWAKYMKAKNFQLMVVPGNHENYDLINRLPIVSNPIENIECECAVYNHNGSNIYFLINPELVINGKKFLVIHGAASQDKKYRTPHENWWEQEEPSVEFYKRAEMWIEKNNWNFDYIISHTAPTSIIKKIKPSYANDNVGVKMQSICDSNIKFKEWHFGHLHKDTKIERDNRMFACHYQKIEKIG